jgi:hypothetical protein
MHAIDIMLTDTKKNEFTFDSNEKKVLISVE